MGNIVFGACGHGMDVGRVDAGRRGKGGARWRRIRSGSTITRRESKRWVDVRRVQVEIRSQWTAASVYSVRRRLGGEMGRGRRWGRG